jgi:transposase InsO family protein
MPFEERSIMSHRAEFCRLALMPGANKRELCRRYAVSSATAYKWLDRYALEGAEGMADRSRRPLTSPSQTSLEVEEAVLAVRWAHPTWGARKIHRVLERDGPVAPPAISTITEILRRHGLLDGPRAGEPRDYQRFEHPEPNDLWQMDFKGHFALDQGRCHPLTVLDDHSRYSLAIRACANEQAGTVKAELERLFGRFGLPRRILCDNGSPWGATGHPGKHTGLSVWLLDLGVGVAHGRPYHPQTQGKEERFHRTLKADALDGKILRSLQDAQETFDAWREIYNTHRPHEGIGMATPSTRYVMSPRPMPEVITPPEYEPQAQVRKVHDTGWISFRGRVINCSNAFTGRRVALRATNADGVFDLCYRSHRLAQIDLREPG